MLFLLPLLSGEEKELARSEMFFERLATENNARSSTQIFCLKGPRLFPRKNCRSIAGFFRDS